MRRIRMGRTGVEASAIGLGTWAHGGPKSVKGHEVGWSGHDETEARGAITAAFDAGIDHFDTADVYGDGQAERLIGSVWGSVPRDEVFLASKVGWDPGPYGQYYHPKLVAQRLERSLELLRTDRLDLYYLHHCDFGPEHQRLDPVLEVLDRARTEGKFRFLGLSDWSSAKVLGLVDRVDPDVVQIYNNVLDDEYASSGLEAWVAENDRAAVFFSALKHGVLLGKYSEPTTFPEGDMRNGVAEFGDAAALDRFRACRRAVERRFPAHPQAVLHAVVGALLASPGSSALVGMRDASQARAAAALGEALSDSEAAWVRAIYRGDEDLERGAGSS